MGGIEAAIAGWPLVYVGLLASLIAGVAAGIGALPVFAIASVSRRTQDVLLGLAAGIMLGATSFSLAIPGIEAGTERFGSVVVGATAVAVGMLAGAVGIWLAHRYLPHEHFIKGREGVARREVRRVWLFVIAITIHNFPEGLAVGVGFGGGDVANGVVLTAGIFLQNLPEGFVVALAILTLGIGRAAAVGIALLTGAVETVGGFVGAGAVSLSEALLPWGLAVAAGAMLFVISHEVIPETHAGGHETPATFAVIVGFAVMMVLDVALA